MALVQYCVIFSPPPLSIARMHPQPEGHTASYIARRKFLATLGGAAAWPLGARAQQPEAADHRLLGLGHAFSLGPWVAAFVQRLRELGWIEGRTIAIEFRWAEGRTERARRDRGRICSAQSRCHCHGGSRSPRRNGGNFGHSDRLCGGEGPARQPASVASLARPGGNVTGLSLQPPDLAGQATRTLARGRSRAPAPGDPGQRRQSRHVLEMAEVETAARTLGLEIATSKSGEPKISRRLRGAQGPRRRTLCR